MDPPFARENIVLLSMLTDEPGKEEEHRLPTLKGPSVDGKLTLKQELSLADTLAFLCGLSASSDDVVAVSVEQGGNGGSLVIRIACNTGIAKPCRENLNDFAESLQRVAQSSDPTHTGRKIQTLFDAILLLDRERIFLRLRSKHAKTTGHKGQRPTRISLLTKAASLIQDANIQPIRRQIRAIERCFSELERLSTSEAWSESGIRVLHRLVFNIHRFYTEGYLEKLLSLLKKQEFNTVDTTATKSLQSAFGKIGRYYSAAKFLVSATERKNVFQAVRVEFVDHTALQDFKIKKLQPHSLKDTLAKIGVVKDLQDPGSIRPLESRFGVSLSAGSQKFSKCLSSKNKKLHAEIQLIIFYELNPSITRPRVICSSKSSCYLCNLFIQYHGQYFTPRTHGVLYKSWAVPSLANAPVSLQQKEHFSRTLNLVNQSIEKQLKIEISRPRQKRKHPNESALAIYHELTPSLQSLAQNQSQSIVAPPSPAEIPVNTENKRTNTWEEQHESPTALVTSIQSLLTKIAGLRMLEPRAAEEPGGPQQTKMPPPRRSTEARDTQPWRPVECDSTASSASFILTATRNRSSIVLTRKSPVVTLRFSNISLEFSWDKTCPTCLEARPHTCLCKVTVEYIELGADEFVGRNVMDLEMMKTTGIRELEMLKGGAQPHIREMVVRWKTDFWRIIFEFG